MDLKKAGSENIAAKLEKPVNFACEKSKLWSSWKPSHSETSYGMNPNRKNPTTGGRAINSPDAASRYFFCLIRTGGFAEISFICINPFYIC